MTKNQLYAVVAEVIAFIYALRARPIKKYEYRARTTPERLVASDIYAGHRAYQR